LAPSWNQPDAAARSAAVKVMGRRGGLKVAVSRRLTPKKNARR
jgi:hypothetical protein